MCTIADLVSLLATQILGNSLYAYVLALGLLLAIFFGFFLLLFIVNNRLNAIAKKNPAHANDALPQVLRKIHPFEYAGIALYIALQTLTINPLLNRVISLGFIALITYMAVDASSVLLSVFLRRMAAGENHHATAPILINLTIIGKALLWVFGIFIVLSNAGVNITSLIAGLGIGGVAVALGLQSILSDLFSSFAIHFDKPFVVGDLILVGDQMGFVEKIGIKTTRIRALQGEEVIFANTLLTGTQIQNFRKMRQRRVVFTIGVAYETPRTVLQEIPALLRTIIENRPKVRFDRAHFFQFDPSALTFEIVYFVLTDDYKTYMDAQQEINFGILEAFAERNIALAHPTQVVTLRQTIPEALRVDLD
ncbi:MAG TPA: mechanosensitive ion channel family protein [Ktedonobacterales bacterium]|nr:mechanosensitive ion channel family protein [Ktedonobacterales bacterium]